MQEQATHTGLDDTIGQLEAALADEVAAERRAVLATRAIALAIVLVAGLFVGVNYLYLERTWTEEALTSSVQEQWTELRPSVIAEMHTLGANVGPVYAKELRRQLPEMGPEVGRALQKQTRRFAGDFRADASARLEATLKNVVQRTTESTFASYPALGDEERVELKQRQRVVLEAAVADAMLSFNERFAADAAAFQSTVMDVPQTKTKTRELLKRFARLWIQWLDEGISKL